MTLSAHIEQPATLDTSRNGVALLLLAWSVATMSLWFFAFYNLPTDAPDWARRAQVACFGSDDMGLPSAAGWMLLILSPAMFLGAIFIALYSDATESIRRLLATALGRLSALLLTIAVITEATWVSASIYERVQDFASIATELSGANLPKGYPRGHQVAPEFSLVNQHGTNQSLSSLRGKPVLLSFVFAHCQAVCPKLITTILSATQNIPKDSVHTIFITLDPWRDTPDSLPQLAMKWALSSDESILSGQPDNVNAVLDSYNVPRQRDEKNGDVAHPSIVHVIDAKGELAYSFNNPSPAWIRESLARLN